MSLLASDDPNRANLKTVYLDYTHEMPVLVATDRRKLGVRSLGLVLPERIEFDPDTEGLPKEGKVYLQIDNRFYEARPQVKDVRASRAGISTRI